MARPTTDNLFPRVRAAREALKDKALVIFDKYMTLIDTAIAASDFETAEKALRFLAEHMPKDEDGSSFLDRSVDKLEKKDRTSLGPQINIGFKLGGVNRDALPPAVIDVTPDE